MFKRPSFVLLSQVHLLRDGTIMSLYDPLSTSDFALYTTVVSRRYVGFVVDDTMLEAIHCGG